MFVPQQLAEVVSAHVWCLHARSRDLHHWRQTVASVLESWGAPAPSVDLACIGVTELLTNVARHVPDDPRCRLKVHRAESVVVVRVYDRSPRLPEVHQPDWDRESGRGLWLLREMCAGLGYERVRGGCGKQVWFRCHLTADRPSD